MTEHKGCMYIHVYMCTHTHTHIFSLEGHCVQALHFPNTISQEVAHRSQLHHSFSQKSLQPFLKTQGALRWQQGTWRAPCLGPWYWWQNNSRHRHMRGMDPDQQAPSAIRVPVPLPAEDMDAYRLQEGVRQSTLKKTLGKVFLLKKTGKNQEQNR